MRRRRNHRGRLAVACALICALLAGCSTKSALIPNPTASPPSASLLSAPPYLESDSLGQLYQAAGSYLRTSGDLERITFRCTIAEGTFCWFGSGPQDGPVAADLARRLVDQIGVNAVDSANRNEIIVECSRPTGAGVASCEIDWGWGAGREPLPIE